jgi:hypothetical protein
VGTVCHSLYAGPEKTYGKRCGNNSPTHCVETITPSLVSIYEVSQASHIQDEDITPLYSIQMSLDRFLHLIAKIQKLWNKLIMIGVISTK